ncbi:ABC transporter ATPase [Mucilaginibacter sp.]|uniref:ABC transporter ATPase n=1 Tax=Mucilaginibacter sp. TaxID=1882438 RepID=UPI003AFF9ED5
MEFSPNSKVWIYQSDREFTSSETARLETSLQQFAQTWTAHNQQLKASAQVVFNRFVILLVDESQAGASGCSIDKSVRFLKEVETAFNVNLFDRFQTAYFEDGQIKSANREELEVLLREGKVNAGTIVFNNMASNLADLQTKWQVPFKNSWHNRVFGSLVQA